MQLRLGLLLMACLCTAACATTSQYKASLDALVGTPEAHLTSLFGTPDETFSSDSSTFLVYASSRSEALGPLPNSLVTYLNYTKTKSCTTVFEVRGGVVAAWAIKGNDCGQELVERHLAKP